MYSDSFVEPIRESLRDKKYIKFNIDPNELEQFTTIGEYKQIGDEFDLKLKKYIIKPKIVKFSLEKYANHFKGFHPVSKMIDKENIDDFFYLASKKVLKYAPLNLDGSIHCLLPTIILRFTKI